MLPTKSFKSDIPNKSEKYFSVFKITEENIKFLIFLIIL